MNRRSESVTASSGGRATTPLRARLREATAQEILAAAEEVFADEGFHAAHMGTIAAKAGVSVGTLYNHFADREAMLAGLLAARRADLIGKLDSAIGGTSGQPLRARLRGILDAFLGHCAAHRKFVHIALQRELGRYQQTFPQAWAKKTDTMREIFQRIDQEIRAGVKEGTLRAEFADVGATFFIGMMRALVIRDVAFGGGDMLEQIDRLLDLFFDGAGVGAGKRKG
jgi:AcrR family transcriptional regulator